MGQLNIPSKGELESFLLPLVSRAEEARESLLWNGCYCISSTARESHPPAERQLRRVVPSTQISTAASGSVVEGYVPH